MAYRTRLATALLLAGCTPRVILSDGGVSGSADATDTVADDDDDGGDESAATIEPPMSSTSPLSTTGPTSDTFGSEGGFDSSGFFGSGSSGGMRQLCWSVQPLFQAPEESRLFVRDQDSDGLAELWLAFFQGGGPGGGSELFWFDTSGQPNPAGFFPGFLTGLHNINGDDALEAMGLAFGGGPPRLSYIEGAPLLFDGPVLPTPFGFEDGFEAIVDIDNDGLDDFLRNLEGTIELQSGGGDGQFFPTSSIGSQLAGDLTVRGVVGNPQLFAISESSFFDEPSACTAHGFELLGVDGKQLAFTTPSSPSGDFVPTEVIGAEDLGTVTNIYARGCLNAEVTVLVQQFVGSEATGVTHYESSSFAAYGDFDGNGRNDLGLGTATLDAIQIHNGTVQGDFPPANGLFSDVPFGQPVPGRVFVVDMDADGRDEIILGTQDGGPEITYERLDLDPC